MSDMSSTAKSSSKSAGPDAIELLKADHKSVGSLFQAFEKMMDRDGAELAERKAELSADVDHSEWNDPAKVKETQPSRVSAKRAS